MCGYGSLTPQQSAPQPQPQGSCTALGCLLDDESRSRNDTSNVHDLARWPVPWTLPIPSTPQFVQIHDILEDFRCCSTDLSQKIISWRNRQQSSSMPCLTYPLRSAALSRSLQLPLSRALQLPSTESSQDRSDLRLRSSHRMESITRLGFASGALVSVAPAHSAASRSPHRSRSRLPV